MIKKYLGFSQERKDKKGNNGTMIEKVGFRNVFATTGSETIRKTRPAV